MRHKKEWFVSGRKIVVHDKMQNYTYLLTYKCGTNIKNGGLDSNGAIIRYDSFKPAYSPQRMLQMGVFEGKYINDGEHEYPTEWYTKARLSKDADPEMNFFGIKSRLSLQEWRDRGWVPVHKKDKDVRGWFQWYCRYYLGRRIPEVDSIQIARWKAFARHYAQVQKHAKNRVDKRKKQRQALLQWAWPCCD